MTPATPGAVLGRAFRGRVLHVRTGESACRPVRDRARLARVHVVANQVLVVLLVDARHQHLDVGLVLELLARVAEDLVD